MYIDETGADGRHSVRQPSLTVAAAIVDETMEQPAEVVPGNTPEACVQRVLGKTVG